MMSSSSPPSTTMIETEAVPYFVLQLSDKGKAKALFTVPSHMAQSLIVHPVLCCGASFVLNIDVVSQKTSQKNRNNSNNNNQSTRQPTNDKSNSSTSTPSSSTTTTSFLSTEFYSLNPEETAKQIAQRIAIRMGGPSPVLSQFLF